MDSCAPCTEAPPAATCATTEPVVGPGTGWVPRLSPTKHVANIPDPRAAAAGAAKRIRTREALMRHLCKEGGVWRWTRDPGGAIRAPAPGAPDGRPQGVAGQWLAGE